MTNVNDNVFMPRNGYEVCFGNLPDKTIYYNPCKWGMRGEGGDMYAGEVDIKNIGKMHMKNKMRMKALQTTTGTYTPVGSPMIAIFPDFLIYDESRKYTPMSVITTRVTNMGDYASWVNITAKGAAATAAEGATIPFVDDTYVRKSYRIKLLYVLKAASGFMQAALAPHAFGQFVSPDAYQGGFSSVNVQNATQNVTATGTRALMEKLEQLIVAGDSTTNVTDFDGIVKQMGTTNSIDKAGADLELNDLHKAAEMAYVNSGRPSIGLCSPAVFTRIQELLTDQVRWLNPPTTNASIAGIGFTGLSLNSIIGIPITVIPSQFLNNTTALRSIYFLDMSVVELRVLQDVTIEKKYTLDKDEYPWLLKMYCVLLVKVPKFCASIQKIK